MEQSTAPIVLTMKAQLEYNAICAELERLIRPQLHPLALELLVDAYASYGAETIQTIQWEEVRCLTSEADIGKWHDLELNERFGCMSLEQLFPLKEGTPAFREFHAIINPTKWQFASEEPKKIRLLTTGPQLQHSQTTSTFANY
jgi:hypothetical protein